MMNETKPFYAKLSRFLESYIKIPKNTYFYEQNGNLTGQGIKNCVDFLIGGGIFANKNDMKTEAFKQYSIIIPDCFFEKYVSKSDTE